MNPEQTVAPASALPSADSRERQLEACRARIREHEKRIGDEFRQSRESTPELLRLRSRQLDELLCEVWRMHAGPALSGAALLAVGGYGREEMYPASDVDVLVLMPQGYSRSARNEVGAFLAFLWDVGLKPGHGTRTVAESRDQARADVTIMTALLEARLLAGSGRLFGQLGKAINARGVWVFRAVLPGQGQGAGASQRGVRRHGLQSGTGRQERTGGIARPAHGALDSQAPVRIGRAGNPGRTGPDLGREAGRAAPLARFSCRSCALHST